jgi:hypothetical protein
VSLVAIEPVGGLAEQVAEDVVPVLLSSAAQAEDSAEQVVAAALVRAEHRCCHDGYLLSASIAIGQRYIVEQVAANPRFRFSSLPAPGSARRDAGSTVSTS